MTFLIKGVKIHNMSNNLISTGPVATNRKAHFHYMILDTYEAGLILTGGEVKSLRMGHASIGESYVSPENGELVLVNARIEEYSSANKGFVTEQATRPRKLLLHQKELSKLLREVNQKGRTIIPLDLYFNARGIAKMKIALAQGKTYADKRETIKQRDWQRDKQRIMAHYNK